jgi:hypothetical protein
MMNFVLAYEKNGLTYFSAFFCILHGSGGMWTWVNGSNAINSSGNIGIKGVSNSSNYPEGRTEIWNTRLDG